MNNLPDMISLREITSDEFKAGYLISRLSSFGITRLADITGLDRLGIPTHSCVLPGRGDAISVYSGKGLSDSHSIISSIMECLERTGPLWNMERVAIKSETELVSEGVEFVSPSHFTEPPNNLYNQTIPMAWILGTSLISERGVFVPADLAFSGFRAIQAPISPFSCVTSNGLAAAFSRKNAIEHALREVMERDVVSCIELSSACFGAGILEDIARLFEINTDPIAKNFLNDPNKAVSVNIATLPKTPRDLIRKFEDIGMQFSVKALPNDFHIPVFGACAIEEMAPGNLLGGAGYAMHLNPEFAIIGAILEVAQARATSLQGAREDYHEKQTKSRLAVPPMSDWLLSPSDVPINFNDIAWKNARSGGESDLSVYIRAVKATELPEIIVVDFPIFEGVSVVRVLIPGAETTHPTGGLSRLGPRATALYDKYVGK
ncbi:YcaO-like family protein [Glaciimonas immobilis]|uniref:Ribosomal protein S12 methylthiotransferase accessory factor n=1 Tax=Glaciimonas immobilis TaxID=728004 RepID=A0A840RQ72_9BURK|nr:YcaO-like family protein [Glaciimonas immobilis]KAF3997025.1 hypothetical protein HAV38_15215 [Glaciimonas immobilis]MBB5199863.1 ribosomal protein S12 methylthiotransferase accessory factor [Glaciimonas immobilis]